MVICLVLFIFHYSLIYSPAKDEAAVHLWLAKSPFLASGQKVKIDE